LAFQSDAFLKGSIRGTPAATIHGTSKRILFLHYLRHNPEIIMTIRRYPMDLIKEK
jgi:hypothetical protein